MVNIPIYNQSEIKQIRVACNLAQQVLVYLEPFIKPGVTTEQLNQLAHDLITKEFAAIPAPLNYNGFPKSICTSINDVVCHGIPSQKDILRNGDILNIDVTVIKDGFYGDTSKMYLVGEVTERNQKLCQATQEMLYAALRAIAPGRPINIIGKVINDIADKYNYGVIRNYIGHGIGNKFHHEPQVLHYRNNDQTILEPGMIFTIEPMINAGSHKDRLMKDNWTVKTSDKSNSAQYEHQVLITETGCEVLTIREEETSLTALLNNL